MKNICMIILSFLALACGDEPLDYPNATGDITGFYQTVDRFGNSSDVTQSDLIHLSGRTERIKYKGDPGSFLFKNVPAGNYSLKISKDGYDSYFQQGLQHFGGSVTQINHTDQRIVIAQKPALEIAEWDVFFTFDPFGTTTLDTYLTIRMKFREHEYQGFPGSVLYVSEHPGVSPENYVEIFFNEHFFADSSGEYVLYQRLFGHRFEPGRTYYAKLFPYNYGTPYYDPDTGRLVVPSLGVPADELAFEIPQ